jgi:carboxyl-terminal processing protease
MPEPTTRIHTIVLAACLLIGVFFVGVRYGEERRPAIERAVSLSSTENPPSVSIDFSPFWSAWNILNEKFVAATSTKITDQDKVWGAITGLAASLKDPYTVFFTPEEAKLFENEITGNFEGVGMEIGIKNETLTVIAPLKGTPAERAGILPGDHILKIDDEVSTTMSVDQAVKRIRGNRGTVVRLTILREGKSDPFEISVTRDTIPIPTIDTEHKPSSTASASDGTGKSAGLTKDGIFIIRLYNFSLNSPQLFQNALRQFIDSGSHKLLLDLRGNPGGFLGAAIDIASWFLPVGKVVVIEDTGESGTRKVHRSRGRIVFGGDFKMVILVNGGSASASEILAGALREHKVATLVGSKTFGKGSVQELVKVTPETSLKVTVARWLTPNGVSISDGGLTPDIEVKMTPEDIEKKKDPQMERAIKLLTE